MPTSQVSSEEVQHFTPITSFPNQPLMLPPTQEKPFIQAPRVIALFKTIKAGKHFAQNPWTAFQFVDGEYDDLVCQLKRNESLFGFVQDKIRYDYDVRSHQLVVRMPTLLHDLFTASVRKAIDRQLEQIRGSNEAALFAEQVCMAGSSTIEFLADDASLSTKPKHDPDASFWHADAEYPGVIIEVAYSQKKKMLYKLAEDYLLDSYAGVQVVVGLDIEYGNKGSRMATLSVWRTELFPTGDGDELRVVQTITDEAFRDHEGNPANHIGLRLELSDFACKELTGDLIRGGNREILVSSQQLCEYLDAAENRFQRQKRVVKRSAPPGVKICKRSETPPETMASDDEANLVEQEQRAARRMSQDDPDYGDR